MKVQGIKLTNGLELIAKVMSNDNGNLVLEDAFFIQIAHAENGSVNMEFVPITVLAKPSGKNHMGLNFTLPSHSILFSYELNDNIVKRFTEVTSGIDLSAATSFK